MTPLPQELVDAIICEVEDLPTLKASCLAGSIFCKESQRSLFRSFNLNCRDRKRFDGLRNLLGESPHIGSYIGYLTLVHLSDLLAADVDILLHTIEKLKNVRRCHITRVSAGFMRWSGILDFLSRQPLHETWVTLATLPADVLFRLLATAPVVSFWHAFSTEPVDDQILEWRPRLSQVQDLTLKRNTKTIEEILLRHEFRDYTESLVRLTVVWSQDFRLIFATAGTLQHIGFDIERLYTLAAPILIPPLPALRSVEFFLRFPCFNTQSNLMSIVLDCSPLLTDLTVSFTDIPKDDSKLFISAKLLNRLDCAVVAHPASPSIRWRLNLDLGGVDVKHRGRFVDLVGLVQSSMPQTHGEGRLMVEAYVKTHDHEYFSTKSR
ncbi:hypothetical protein B0H16DRAFT_204660 [Mycena metata]|uniref:Ig-like domain-containing protein n=1 Tax=Mycena metata TaxID=1033252 RepID=A0AAD7I0J4_9AGAR|nr:hypothetical protein B0H16DRAFT_204660 [Mycena metata]